MSDNWQSSYFLEEKDKPINPKTACLNESLQTQYLDLDDEDNSWYANSTRSISRCVGSFCTPRQVLGLLRVLKAITLCFIVLTILSNLTYMLFVELFSPDEMKKMAGGSRDTVLRIYGLGLSLLGLAVELDYSKVMKKFSGLKGFLPRAILYFFISQLTATHRIMYFKRQSNNNSNNNEADYSNNNANGDDGAADGDDANGDDDNSAAYESSSAEIAEELKIPTSAIGFQRVTSFVLGLCALGYLICGLLCFDRFTARAFLSTKDPRTTTAIPSQQHVTSESTDPNADNDQQSASVEDSTNDTSSAP